MLTISICDSDALYCKELDQKIKEFFHYCMIDVEIIPSFTTESLFAEKRLQKCQYIFLNLIPSEFSAIEGFLNAMREKNESIQIIFMSDQAEMVFEALKYPIYYFIRKNVFLQDLEIVLNRIKDDYRRKPTFFIFQVKDGIERVNVSNIVYIESYQHLILVHCRNKVIEVSDTLSHLYENLKSYDFVQIHKSYLVNLYFITKLTKTSAFLDDTISLPISRHRKQEVTAKMDGYIRRLGWLKTN